VEKLTPLKKKRFKFTFSDEKNLRFHVQTEAAPWRRGKTNSKCQVKEISNLNLKPAEKPRDIACRERTANE